ncbi:Exocyst complex component EXO70B1 [Raphanus sativus]|nr:Exocyst complex component EXO70B1 [Raphanus sativus]
MAENGEEKLLAVARHIAKTLGHNESMADDILQIFSTFDGRFSREKLSEDHQPGDDGSSGVASLERALNSLDSQISRFIASDQPIWSDPADSAAFLDSIRRARQPHKRLEPRLLRETYRHAPLTRRRHDAAGHVPRRGGVQIPHGSRRRTTTILLRSPWHSPSPTTTSSSTPSPPPRSTTSTRWPSVCSPAGFGKACSHVYSASRREFLEESVSRLGLQKQLSIEDVHKMQWQELEDEIDRWIKAANVALRILFPSERRLCDRVFFGFSSAADLSFMEVCRGSTIQLLNFADAVAIGSRSPERLFKVLDVFETMRDLMPEFESVFSDQFCLVLRNEAVTILETVWGGG